MDITVTRPPPHTPSDLPNLLLPPLSGGGSFDLILAADVVWLDDLVEPLVRTLERLTAGWPGWSPPSDGADMDSSREQQETTTKTTTTTAPLATIQAPAKAAAAAAAREKQASLGGRATRLAADVVVENDGTAAVTADRLRGSATTERPPRTHEKTRAQRPTSRPGERRVVVGRQRRVLLAYQWRSERTGKTLLEELGKAFIVREIPPEVCRNKTVLVYMTTPQMS